MSKLVKMGKGKRNPYRPEHQGDLSLWPNAIPIYNSHCRACCMEDMLEERWPALLFSIWKRGDEWRGATWRRGGWSDTDPELGSSIIEVAQKLDEVAIFRVLA